MGGVTFLVAFCVFLFLFVSFVLFLVRLNKKHEEKRKHDLFIGGFRDNSDPKIREHFQKTFGTIKESMHFKMIGHVRLWYLMKDNDESSDTPFFFLETENENLGLPTEEVIFSSFPDNTLGKLALKTVSLLSGYKNALEAPFPYHHYKIYSKRTSWSGQVHADVWKELAKHPPVSLTFSPLGVRFDLYPLDGKKSSDLLAKDTVTSVTSLSRAILRR